MAEDSSAIVTGVINQTGVSKEQEQLLTEWKWTGDTIGQCAQGPEVPKLKGRYKFTQH